MPPEDEMHEMENIEYLPDRAVLHRIIDIVEINTPSSSSDTAGSEERILTTKGDHNPIPDRYPVNALLRRSHLSPPPSSFDRF